MSLKVFATGILKELTYIHNFVAGWNPFDCKDFIQSRDECTEMFLTNVFACVGPTDKLINFEMNPDYYSVLVFQPQEYCHLENPVVSPCSQHNQ